jgi:hypothetical protein
LAGSRACSARLSLSPPRPLLLLWLPLWHLPKAKAATARVAVAAVMADVAKVAVRAVAIVVIVVKAAVKAAQRDVAKVAANAARAMAHVANATSAPWPKVKRVRSAPAVAAAQHVMTVLAWKCRVA